jgi:hypothetical protein
LEKTQSILENQTVKKSSKTYNVNRQYQIINFCGEEIKHEISKLTRKDIIDWLQWNDSNGIYHEEQSSHKLGDIIGSEEGVEIMLRQMEGRE